MIGSRACSAISLAVRRSIAAPKTVLSRFQMVFPAPQSARSLSAAPPVAPPTTGSIPTSKDISGMTPDQLVSAFRSLSGRLLRAEKDGSGLKRLPGQAQPEVVNLRAACRRLLGAFNRTCSSGLLSQFQPQSVVDMAVTLAQDAQWPEAQRSLVALSDALVLSPTLSLLDSSQLAKIAWAYQSARLTSQTELFGRLGDRMLSLISSNTAAPSDITTVCTAFARTSVRAPKLFSGIANSVMKNVASYDLRGLATIGVAFVNANETATLLHTSIADRATMLMPSSSPGGSLQHVANLAWALVHQDVFHTGFFRALKANFPVYDVELKGRGYWAMHTVALSLKLCCHLPGANLPDSFLLRGPDVLRASPPTPSKLSISIAEAFARQAGCEPLVRDCFSPEGVLIELGFPSHRIAVVASTRNHYTTAYGPPALGMAAATHRRHLVAIGWTVIDVPYFEWKGLRGRGMEDEYIRDKLLPHRAVLFK